MDSLRSEGPITLDELETVGAVFTDLALRAGQVILRIYGNPRDVRSKPDKSPVSEADLLAEAVILEGLSATGPGLSVVSEEAVAGGAFILVDPLDGTREFLKENGEFTVNIALVAGGNPLLGVVYAPVTGNLWLGGTASDGSSFAIKRVYNPLDLEIREQEQALCVRKIQAAKACALASRSHLDEKTIAYLAKVNAQSCERIGSSLKFCLLAEGLADVYPRYAPTMEWDTAAGDAVLRAAGGMVFSFSRQPLVYGKPGFRNGPFLACAKSSGSAWLLNAFV